MARSIHPGASPDVCIAGAGIIGLALALELHDRGLAVVVLDRAAALTEASTAAAGMLAVEDPDNPPQLLPLSQLSRSLYPAFLDRLHTLSRHRVHFQTRTTLQSICPAHTTLPSLTPEQLRRLLLSLASATLASRPLRFTLLDEASVDPRELATALLAAIHAANIPLLTGAPVLSVESHSQSVEIHTSATTTAAGHFVDCTGAWSLSAALLPHMPVTPRKGQMLSVPIPPSFPLDTVVRTPDLYIVPRTAGPNRGLAVIGATIENAGFDKTVSASAITRLHAAAAALLPSLASAPVVQSWSGLRPATPDQLPLLGHLSSREPEEHPRRFIASGHFRNGILLAPATARVMADLLTGQPPLIDLAAFSPQRSPPDPLA